MGRGTANVGQDHFRRVVLREHDIPGGSNITLIQRTVETCLELGWYTILEGIFYEPHYGGMLRSLAAAHQGTCHVFYLDLPLEETITRHQQRPLATEVTADQLRSWYHPRDLLGLPTERVLDAREPLDQLTREITDHVGPVEAMPDGAATHFL